MSRQPFEPPAVRENESNDWRRLTPGDDVHVDHPLLGQFSAVIDDKTRDSSAVWVIEERFKSRHLLVKSDEAAITRRE